MWFLTTLVLVVMAMSSIGQQAAADNSFRNTHFGSKATTEGDDILARRPKAPQNFMITSVINKVANLRVGQETDTGDILARNPIDFKNTAVDDKIITNSNVEEQKSPSDEVTNSNVQQTSAATVGKEENTQDSNSNETLTKDPNVKRAVSGNNAFNKDPLAQYKLTDDMLVDKLRLLMRNEVCRNKTIGLQSMLPDILKGAKAGNCKYSCEQYVCKSCTSLEMLVYRDPFVAIGNCTIWSEGLEYNVDYVGKLYGDKLSYKIYFETAVDADVNEKPKLYKSGRKEEIGKSLEKDLPGEPNTVSAYVIHSLLSG